MNKDNITIGVIGVRSLPNTYGGFERFIEILVTNNIFASSVHFNVYIEGTGKKQISPWVTLIGVGVLKSRHPVLFYLKSSFMAANQCAVILSCGVGVFLGAFYIRARGKRLVVNPDGLEWKRSKWSRFGRVVIKVMYWPAIFCANKVIIDSKALAKYFSASAQMKMTYIPYQAIPVPGLNILERPPQSQISLSKPYLLVICRLEPENSVREIIEGWEPHSDELDLIVVGDTATPYYKRELHSYSDSARFLSSIYDQKLLNQLRRYCAGYIHGHTVGGTNPSLLEAMVSVSAPIVMKDTEFNREVLGSNGHYFSDAASLERLLSNLDRLAGNQSLHPDPRFDEHHIAEKYLEALSK